MGYNMINRLQNGRALERGREKREKEKENCIIVSVNMNIFRYRYVLQYGRGKKSWTNSTRPNPNA